jgi:hypothetical protein
MTGDTIRVWDVSDSSKAFANRTPTFVYDGPWARINKVHFVDNTTIETSSSEGLQYWDVRTGLPVTKP